MARLLTTVREVVAAIGPVPEVARIFDVSEEAIYMAIKRNRLDPRHYLTVPNYLPEDVDVDRALFRRGELRSVETLSTADLPPYPVCSLKVEES